MPSSSHRGLIPSLVAALTVMATVAIVGPSTTASAAPVPSGYTYEDYWYTSHDGIQIHAGVFLPADRAPDEKHPVLMNIGPYTAPNGGATSPGNLNGIINRNPELFTHPGLRTGRWAYVQVDARGFGGSEGCFEYYMPNEAKDAKVSVEWAAAQPWSTGKVALWGKSYDGAQQVLALSQAPASLAATVIQAPGLSGYTALWMNGVHYATGRYGTTGVYTAEDLAPPHNLDTLSSAEYGRAAASPVTSLPGNPTCRSDAVAAMNAIRDRDDPFWQGKEAYKGAAGANVPTFWVHGFWDANTKPVHLDIWQSLTGTKQAWFGQWDHIRGHEAGVGRREHFLDEAFRFLDEHVRGIQPAVEDAAVSVQSGNDEQAWRFEEAWPPSDVSTWTAPVRAGTYVDEPGNSGTALGEGHWSMTAPLPHPAHLAGETVLKIKSESLVPYTNLVAHLYDIDESGAARLVTRGASATSEFGVEEEIFALYPQDWVFEEGHRIAIRISGSDDPWFTPGVSMTEVSVLEGSLELPLLHYIRDDFVDGGAGNGPTGTFIVPAATIVAATVDADPPPAQEPRPE